MVLTVVGKSNDDGSFNWKDAICDAGIMAFLTFFTTLGGTSALNIPTFERICSAAISGATQFFLVLAIKRGLKEK